MAKTSRKIHQQLREDRKRKKKQQRLIWSAIGGVILITLISFVAWGIQSTQARANIGERMAYQGQDHVPDGGEHEPYNSDPPTSGSHSASAVNAGFYDTPIPDENILHNLEHGHVAISYDCAQLDDCESVQKNLRRIVKDYDTWKVIVVPRTNRDAPIALTAWQRLQLLDGYDEDAITTFIDAWRDKGPEKTPE